VKLELRLDGVKLNLDGVVDEFLIGLDGVLLALLMCFRTRCAPPIVRGFVKKIQRVTRSSLDL